MKVQYYEYKNTDYGVLYFKQHKVFVSGCDKCKECCGPEAATCRLPLLSTQNKELFYTIDNKAYIVPEHGCKQLGKRGCKCKIRDKPVVCNIYPFFLIGKELRVHKRCPAVLQTTLYKLQRIGLEVADYLTSLPVEYVFELSENGGYDCIGLDIFLDM